ncbi:hypothetical protein HK104_000004 [Borealophlyctis nickersoniae]|nr:hypothetical protein HK104_000004 [Borealophlyctis nickersoniae]
MANIKVTMKVVLALVTCRDIVTDAWVRAFENFKDTEFALPDPKRYTPLDLLVRSRTQHPTSTSFLPSVVEEPVSLDGVSFLPNPDRQTVLKGYTMYQSLSKIVSAASGTVENRTAQFPKDDVGSLTEYLRSFPKPCVINPDGITAERANVIQKAAARCEDAGMHSGTSGNDDVAKAVLHVSAERFCNPSVNHSSQRAQPMPIAESQYENSVQANPPGRVPMSVTGSQACSLAPSQVPSQQVPARNTSVKNFDCFLDDLIGATADEPAALQLDQAPARMQESDRFGRGADIGSSDAFVEKSQRRAAENPVRGETPPLPHSSAAPKRKLPFEFDDDVQPGLNEIGAQDGRSSSRASKSARVEEDMVNGETPRITRKGKLEVGSEEKTRELNGARAGIEEEEEEERIPSTPPAKHSRTSATRDGAQTPVEGLETAVKRETESPVLSRSREGSAVPTPGRKRKTALAKSGVDAADEQQLEDAVRYRHHQIKKEKEKENDERNAAVLVDEDEISRLRGLVRVEFADLVVPIEKRATIALLKTDGSAVPNFKRFTKNGVVRSQASQARIVTVEPYERDNAFVLGKDGEGWAIPESKQAGGRGKNPGCGKEPRKGRKTRPESEEEEEDDDDDDDEEDVEMVLGDDDDSDEVDEAAPTSGIRRVASSSPSRRGINTRRTRGKAPVVYYEVDEEEEEEEEELPRTTGGSTRTRR